MRSVKKNNASTTHAQSTEASFELSPTFTSRRNASSSPRKISLTGHRFKSCERSPCDLVATGVVRESSALHLQLEISMAVSFNEASVFGTSMHKRLIISIRSKLLLVMVCLVPLKGPESVRPLTGPSSVPHIPVHPPLSGRSRQFHRKWLCRHPFVVTCQFFGFASAKAEDRDPQPAAGRCFGSAGDAVTFTILQIQSRLGCNVVRRSAKELRWTGRTAALTNMWFIPLLTLKLSVEMMITMSPFNTHSIVDSPRSATHFRKASDYNDDIASKAKLPAREALPIKSHPPPQHFLSKLLALAQTALKNGRPDTDISEKVLCTATSPSMDTAATELAASVFVWFEPPIAFFVVAKESWRFAPRYQS